MSQAHSIFTNPDPQFWDRKKLYVYQNQYIRIKLWGDALYVYCVDGKLQAIDEMFIYRYQWVEYMERLALGTAKVRDRRQLACFVYTMQTKGWKKVSTIYSYLEKQSSVAITTSFTKLLLTTQHYKSQSFKKNSQVNNLWYLLTGQMFFGYANFQDRVYQTYTLKKLNKTLSLVLVFPVFNAHIKNMHKNIVCQINI